MHRVHRETNTSADSAGCAPKSPGLRSSGLFHIVRVWRSSLKLHHAPFSCHSRSDCKLLWEDHNGAWTERCGMKRVEWGWIRWSHWDWFPGFEPRECSVWSRRPVNNSVHFVGEELSENLQDSSSGLFLLKLHHRYFSCRSRSKLPWEELNNIWIEQWRMWCWMRINEEDWIPMFREHFSLLRQGWNQLTSKRQFSQTYRQRRSYIGKIFLTMLIWSWMRGCNEKKTQKSCTWRHETKLQEHLKHRSSSAARLTDGLIRRSNKKNTNFETVIWQLHT